jgi:chromate transporter
MPGLLNLSAYFLKLGTVVFGGPVALIERMQRDLVEERRWVSPRDFTNGLALSKISPGPMATQLAIYIGFLQGGVVGATAAALALVLPSFLMVVAMAAIYTRGSGLWWMRGLFYGIGAAVLSIIARSAYRLARRTLGKARLLWALAALMTAMTVVTRYESVWLFAACGLVALLVYAPPAWFSRPRLRADAVLLTAVFLFFLKASALVYGGGLAIVPFLYGGVVHDHRWLTERQFIDAVAVAMITPGPVVITVVFIGYLVASFLGAAAAALGIFLPVYVFTVIPAPWFSRNRDNAQLKAFVQGATAAATGALSGAVVVIALRAIYDVPTILIALASFGVLWRYKIPEPIIVLAAAIVGLVVWPLMRGV